MLYKRGGAVLLNWAIATVLPGVAPLVPPGTKNASIESLLAMHTPPCNLSGQAESFINSPQFDAKMPPVGGFVRPLYPPADAHQQCACALPIEKPPQGGEICY